MRTAKSRVDFTVKRTGPINKQLKVLLKRIKCKARAVIYFYSFLIICARSVCPLFGLSSLVNSASPPLNEPYRLSLEVCIRIVRDHWWWILSQGSPFDFIAARTRARADFRPASVKDFRRRICRASVMKPSCARVRGTFLIRKGTKNRTAIKGRPKGRPAFHFHS